MRYPVLEPLGYGRPKPYMPGETVTIADEDADELIAGGIIGEAIPGSDVPQLNVGETVKLVQATATIEDLDKLAEGETRKGVLDAIAKRRAELAPSE